MINGVVTSLANSLLVRAPPPELTAAANPNLPVPEVDHVVSSIRVDVDADLAILEFRSLETGDVLRQYPTEKQIARYQRAAQLEVNQDTRQQIFAKRAPTTTGGEFDLSTISVASSDVSVQSAPSPAPAAPNPAVDVNAGVSQLSDTSSVSATA